MFTLGNFSVQVEQRNSDVMIVNFSRVLNLYCVIYYFVAKGLIFEYYLYSYLTSVKIPFIQNVSQISTVYEPNIMTGTFYIIYTGTENILILLNCSGICSVFTCLCFQFGSIINRNFCKCNYCTTNYTQFYIFIIQHNHSVRLIHFPKM